MGPPEVAEVEHGTHAGYRRHQRNRNIPKDAAGEWSWPACRRCRIGHRKYSAKHR